MSNIHRPKTFRSFLGCCICGTKSSSSRFTDSNKYQADFNKCFNIADSSTGDICNACVLLVKRSKKLPKGSTRNWSHVVGAKSTNGGCLRATNKSAKVTKVKPVSSDPDLKQKKIIKKRKVTRPRYQPPTTPDIPSSAPEPSSLIDPDYWKRTKVCCGEVFIGDGQFLLIDLKLYKPCCAVHKKHSGPTRDRTDTLDSRGSSNATSTEEVTTAGKTQKAETCKVGLRPTTRSMRQPTLGVVQ